MNRSTRETCVVVGAGALAIAAAAMWVRRYSRENRIPKDWVEIGEVGDLWMYPLKSGRALEVEDAECTGAGFVLRSENKFALRDRALLVYSEDNGQYRTARNHPNMVLVSVTAVDPEHIKFEAPGMEHFVTEIPSDRTAPIPCTLWQNESVICLDCGDEAAAWISRYCLTKDNGLRLGMCTERRRNVSDPPWSILKAVYDRVRDEDMGIYSDLSSYMIMNQASLEDLNERLPETVSASALNFRPNIVVQGPEAYAEDNWNWIKIGKEVVLRNFKPCTRCIMVNIDPETGIPVPEQKVLKKLKEYRQLTDSKQRELEGSSPAFGVYAGIHKLGHVKLGDKVYIGRD